MVDNAARLALHRSARERLGDAEGDTLMSLLPPANTAVATRQDLELLETRVGAKIDAGIAGLRTEVLKRIDRAQWRMITAFIVSVLVQMLGQRFL